MQVRSQLSRSSLSFGQTEQGAGDTAAVQEGGRVGSCRAPSSQGAHKLAVAGTGAEVGAYTEAEVAHSIAVEGVACTVAEGPAYIAVEGAACTAAEEGEPRIALVEPEAYRQEVVLLKSAAASPPECSMDSSLAGLAWVLVALEQQAGKLSVSWSVAAYCS